VDANEQARNAELVDAETHRDQLRAEAEKPRAAIADAERDAQNIQARAAADAASERGRLLAEVQTEGERLLRNAEGELQRARFAARDRLRIEFIEKALIKARAEAGGPARRCGQRPAREPRPSRDSLGGPADAETKRSPGVTRPPFSQLAQEADKIAEVQRDLRTFTAALDAQAGVRKFFVSPVVDRSQKAEIVATAFASSTRSRCTRSCC